MIGCTMNIASELVKKIINNDSVYNISKNYNNASISDHKIDSVTQIVRRGIVCGKSKANESSKCRK